MFGKVAQSTGNAITRMTAVNPYIGAAVMAASVLGELYSQASSSQNQRLPAANIPGGQPRINQDEQIDIEEEINGGPIEEEKESAIVPQQINIIRRQLNQQVPISYQDQPFIPQSFMNQNIIVSQESLQEMTKTIPKEQKQRDELIAFTMSALSQNQGLRLDHQIIADYFLMQLFIQSPRTFDMLSDDDQNILRSLFFHVVVGGLSIANSRYVNINSSRSDIVDAFLTVIQNIIASPEILSNNLPDHLIYLIIYIRNIDTGLIGYLSGYQARQTPNRNQPVFNVQASPDEILRTMQIHISLATNRQLFDITYAQMEQELQIQQSNDEPTRRLAFHIIMSLFSQDTLPGGVNLINDLMRRIRNTAGFSHDDLTRLLAQYGVRINATTDFAEQPKQEEVKEQQPKTKQQIKKQNEQEQAYQNKKQNWQQIQQNYISQDVVRRLRETAQSLTGRQTPQRRSVSQSVSESPTQWIEDILSNQARDLGSQIEFNQSFEEREESKEGNEEKKAIDAIRQNQDSDEEPLLGDQRPNQAQDQQQQPPAQLNQQQMMAMRLIIEQYINRLVRNRFVLGGITANLIALGGIYATMVSRTNSILDAVNNINNTLAAANRTNSILDAINNINNSLRQVNNQLTSIDRTIFENQNAAVQNLVKLLGPGPPPSSAPIDEKKKNKKPKVVIKENEQIDLPPMKFIVKKELELKRRDLEDETPIENIIKTQDEMAPVKPRRGRPRKPIPQQNSME